MVFEDYDEFMFFCELYRRAEDRAFEYLGVLYSHELGKTIIDDITSVLT